MSATSRTIAKQEGCTLEEAEAALRACAGDPVAARNKLRRIRMNTSERIRQLAETSPFDYVGVQQVLTRLDGNLAATRAVLEAAYRLNADPMALIGSLSSGAIHGYADPEPCRGESKSLLRAPVDMARFHAGMAAAKNRPCVDQDRARAALEAAEAEFRTEDVNPGLRARDPGGPELMPPHAQTGQVQIKPERARTGGPGRIGT